MSPSESATVDNAVITQLSVENAAWQALLNVMSKEEQALTDGDADQLPELNTSKLAQLQTLNNLVRARNDRSDGRRTDRPITPAWMPGSRNMASPNITSAGSVCSTWSTKPRR